MKGNRDFLVGELEVLHQDFSWNRVNRLMDYAEEHGIVMSWDFVDEDTVIISVDDDIIKIEL